MHNFLYQIVQRKYLSAGKCADFPSVQTPSVLSANYADEMKRSEITLLFSAGELQDGSLSESSGFAAIDTKPMT